MLLKKLVLEHLLVLLGRSYRLLLERVLLGGLESLLLLLNDGL
jgi:hypothetical protein